ncbi:hypothetical protein S40293_05729 [Stachybotrys chartarum IBT 40293]|nr:hypothetical protein S40293_05729 [Stachybotrys chartarum IBT 40293]
MDILVLRVSVERVHLLPSPIVRLQSSAQARDGTGRFVGGTAWRAAMQPPDLAFLHFPHVDADGNSAAQQVTTNTASIPSSSPGNGWRRDCLTNCTLKGKENETGDEFALGSGASSCPLQGATPVLRRLDGRPHAAFRRDEKGIPDEPELVYSVKYIRRLGQVDIAELAAQVQLSNQSIISRNIFFAYQKDCNMEPVINPPMYKNPMGDYPQHPWSMSGAYGASTTTAGSSASSCVCPAQELSAFSIDCSKAKVIMCMFFGEHVFNSKLHEGRSNWACPFGNCRDNFSDFNTLMLHAVTCGSDLTQSFYCNCCDRHDCFAFSPCSPGGSPSMCQRFRKLKNFLPRSRASSKSSSHTSPDPGSPTSTTSLARVLAYLNSMHSPSSGDARNRFPAGDTEAAMSPTTMCRDSPQTQRRTIFGGQLHSDQNSCELDGIARPSEIAERYVDYSEEAGNHFDGLSSFSSPPPSLFVEMTNPQFYSELPSREPPMIDTTMAGWTMSMAKSSLFSPILQQDAGSPCFPAPASNFQHLTAYEASTYSCMVGQDLTASHEPVDASTTLHSPENPFPSDEPNTACSGPLLNSSLTTERATVISPRPVGLQCEIPAATSSEFQFSGQSASSASDSSSSWLSTPRDSQSNQSTSANTSPTGSERFRCDFEGCTFTPGGNPDLAQQYLKKHRSTHDPDTFRCGGCGSSFTRKDNLRAHEKKICNGMGAARRSRRTSETSAFTGIVGREISVSMPHPETRTFD